MRRKRYQRKQKFVVIGKDKFANSRTMRASVSTWSTCQPACVPAWFMYQRAKSVPTSHFYVASCQTVWQCLSLACERAKRLANFSTWRANVSKGVPIFQTFLLRNAQLNFHTLYYIKNSTTS